MKKSLELPRKKVVNPYSFNETAGSFFETTTAGNTTTGATTTNDPTTTSTLTTTHLMMR